MQRYTTKKIIKLILLVALAIFVSKILLSIRAFIVEDADFVVVDMASQKIKPKPIVVGEEVYTGMFYPFTITTTNPIKELEAKVGEQNLNTVLILNRLDNKFLKQNSTVIIPRDFTDMKIFNSFPENVSIAKDIPKLMLISQRVQSFAVYEYGQLIRSGAVSTGKQSTPTASKIYFTNWKGKEVKSSFDDEWILKWNFNLDNHEGIGMHQYEMPGYPASHSCIRMFEADAMWIYDWADQWILSPNQQNIVAHGTPVIIFGDYRYDKKAPWKDLPKNESAIKISDEEIETAINQARVQINQSLVERSTTTQ